ncbi:MAG: glycosyltransferase [Xanthobacteraceae bacterium]|nr:glycosyltransferase [Xanthobacteraceae bacterium]
MTHANVLLVTGTAYLPQVVGGVELNTHEMATELNRRGCKTAVLAKLSPRDAFGATRLLLAHWRGVRTSVDQNLGYAVYRSRNPCELSDVPLPDVAVIQNGRMLELAEAFARRGVPCVAYFHGLPFECTEQDWHAAAVRRWFAGYIANSAYTARRFRARCGIDAHVIPPIFNPARYQAIGERRFATFINPVAAKGLELVLAVAELCPEIPFRFVKAWPLSPAQSLLLKRRVAQLHNVQLLERRTDMRSIYAGTRVLLVPSKPGHETWGRVASEAQFSGIPVLASDAGGLPEAVGPGGTIMPDNASPQAWAGALQRLWTEREHYEAKSAAALAHSRRGAINLDRQLHSLRDILAHACSGNSASIGMSATGT